MDVYALFTDGTSENIMIDTVAKKDNDKGLVIRTTINSPELKESAIRNVKNALVVLDKHYSDLYEDMAICIYGFSNSIHGNSADLSFSLSFVSYLLENNILQISIPMPKKIAATGVIDERLNIRGIKGLKEKLRAAVEAEAEVIFFPKENESEFEELKNSNIEFYNLLRTVKIVPVQTLEEAFAHLGVIGSINVPSTEISFYKRKAPALIILFMIFLIPSSILVYKELNKSPKNLDSKAIVNYSTPFIIKTSDISNTESVVRITPKIKATTNTSPTNTIPSSDNLSTNTPNITQIQTSRVPSPKLNESSKVLTTPVTNVITSPNAKPLVNNNGNSSANLMNYGFVSAQGDWIYYLDNLDIGLYKAKMDGSNKTLINKNFATYINVIDNYIYYISKGNNSLYKLKTDSTKIRRLNDDEFMSFLVDTGKIYYVNMNDNRIYRIDTNGFDRTPLLSGFFDKISEDGTKFQISNLNVDNNNIFFQMKSENNVMLDGIYKFAANGSNPVCLVNEQIIHMCIEKRNLFYISSKDRCLYKADLNGHNTRKIISENIETFNISSNWIYYCNKNGLFKIDQNGEFSAQINTDKTKKINVLGDWIYYLNSNDGNRIYRVGINGKNRHRLE